MQMFKLFEIFHYIATHPKEQMRKYLAQGKKVVLCGPYYVPEEIVHGMGAIPLGIWGGDFEVQESKRYLPAFFCSIVHGILDLGARGCYEGTSALILPELCDSLCVLGENWKYAVPDIPMIPMTYPDQRKKKSGEKFLENNYKEVICRLEKCLGTKLKEEDFQESINIYDEHSKCMRIVEMLMSQRSDIPAVYRSDVFKSAFFVEKTEHIALLKELIECLGESKIVIDDKIPIYISGIIADHPGLNTVFDEAGYRIVGDDIAAQSRLYRVDVPKEGDALSRLVKKFCMRDDCSLLYDSKKHHGVFVAEEAKKREAKAIIVLMTKFCDPEEFDYPQLRENCKEAGIPVIQVEIDRQMDNFAQIRTALDTLKDMLQ